SSRLIASLRVDGHELASARLLVNAVRFDAQGRLLSAPVATEATRIAYADEFEHWLDRGEKVSEPKHPTS
ncbi:MAG: hypothetical protein ABI614_23945, partial [Planctomycetota bacterium]